MAIGKPVGRTARADSCLPISCIAAAEAIADDSAGGHARQTINPLGIGTSRGYCGKGVDDFGRDKVLPTLQTPSLSMRPRNQYSAAFQVAQDIVAWFGK